jgi:hypothetical protein
MVTFKLAVSAGNPMVDGVNEIPILQRFPVLDSVTGPASGEHAGGGAFTEGATIEKSPGLLPPEIAKVALLRAVVPAFSNVPSISEATPTGTDPKFTGVGVHPAMTQKFPIEVKNSGKVMGPFTKPDIGRDSVSVSASASLTVRDAVAKPGAVPRGTVKVKPNQQDAPTARDD